MNESASIDALVVDAVYRSSKTSRGGLTDPLVGLVGVARQGGFRYRGSRFRPTLLVLTSSLVETDWPDELDPATGRFVYYGDNRHSGRQLHDTPRFGNQLLKSIFDLAHSRRRTEVPPVLIFTSESPGRSFRFRGLAVPGFPNMPPTEDLVAIWKTNGSERFQNYRAVFTILDEPQISREWILSLGSGVEKAQLIPPALKTWRRTGVARALAAPRTKEIRSKAEQLPSNEEECAIVDAIRSHYTSDPFGFEKCAGAICKLLLGSDVDLELTRPWRDGGRDGIGRVRLGSGQASLQIAFALEAKCYSMNNGVGVREVSRLISRIKHREFGVMITTSFVDKQAYREVVDDGHPVIFVTGADIARLLRNAGTNARLVPAWLEGIASLNQ